MKLSLKEVSADRTTISTYKEQKVSRLVAIDDLNFTALDARSRCTDENETLDFRLGLLFALK
jgi:hypothetical protein